MTYAKIIKDMKRAGKGLMSEVQYMRVAKRLSQLSPCNFLVFGLGEDALAWKEINEGGRTAFLEDDRDWIGQFSDKDLEIYPVEYNTRAQDHHMIGFESDKLEMELPEEILDTKWDIIFVDGPLGHNPPRPYKGPGRMKSIHAAYNLLKDGGTCVVDDMGREIERKYSFHYFDVSGLCELVEGKVGIFKKIG